MKNNNIEIDIQDATLDELLFCLGGVIFAGTKLQEIIDIRQIVSHGTHIVISKNQINKLETGNEQDKPHTQTDEPEGHYPRLDELGPRLWH